MKTRGPLNPAQKIIVLATICLLVAMILYPPWVRIGRYYGDNSVKYADSYTFIWSPPERACFIDLYRLLVQCAGLIVVAGGFCLLVQRKSKGEE